MALRDIAAGDPGGVSRPGRDPARPGPGAGIGPGVAGALLERAIAPEPPATLAQPGVIRPGYSPELDAIVEGAREAREWIAGLEAEKNRTGIKTLKVGYNKIFGYYIEVSRGQANSVPADYIRKQTLVNGERFITPEMKEYETRVLNAEERIREVEMRLFREVVRPSASPAVRTAGDGALDWPARIAWPRSRKRLRRRGYVCPAVVPGNALDIREGRHPVVERISGRRTASFPMTPSSRTARLSA